MNPSREFSRQELDPNVVIKVLKEAERDPISPYNNTERWGSLAKEALEQLPSELRPESSLDANWEDIPHSNMVEGKDEGGFFQIKRFKIKIENSNLFLEERVKASSYEKESLDSQDFTKLKQVKKASELIVRSEDGKEIKINDILPPGHSLRPSLNEATNEVENRILARRGKNQILLTNYEGAKREELDDGFKVLKRTKEIFYGDLSHPGQILKLLHEIGHAWDYYSKPEPETRVLEVNIAQLRDIYNKLQLEDGAKIQVDEGTVCIKRDMFNEAGSPLIIDKKLLEKILREIIDAERGPSAFALHIISSLRKQGLNLEPNMKLANFREALGNALKSYQSSLERIYYSSEDKEKMKNVTFQ